MSHSKASHTAIVNARTILRDEYNSGFGQLEDDPARPFRRVVIGREESDHTGEEVVKALVQLLEKAGGKYGSTIKEFGGILSSRVAVEAEVGVLREARKVAQGQRREV